MNIMKKIIKKRDAFLNNSVQRAFTITMSKKYYKKLKKQAKKQYGKRGKLALIYGMHIKIDNDIKKMVIE